MENSLPKRKNIRIPKYDYSKPGYYFITICTKNRKNILSIIENFNKDKTVGVDAHIDPKIKLTPIGNIVEKHIQNFNKKTEEIRVYNYVVMPNHIHLIVELNCEDGSMRASTPTQLSQFIKTLKILSTKEIGYSIWQRNYYEHVIRNEKEHLKILEYIENNPFNWVSDKYFSE